jgi:ABC-type nitrate/sulfonate/bicarbonate transport system ATPase subunit
MPIEVHNLSLKYPQSPTHVFKQLSFRLTTPGFHSLFGPSGVGKTSLAKIITGDLACFHGEILRTDVQTCLYSYNLERLPGWSSVGKHLEKVTPSGRQGRRDELIEAFKLDDCVAKRFMQLSLGQKNRVNLLRYLLQDFDLLIMDESLANVDELTRGHILIRIKEMFPATHFLYISHNVIEVSRYCHTIVVLRGANKTPSSCIVQGQNAEAGKTISPSDLDQTMLEIVNASS